MAYVSPQTNRDILYALSRIGKKKLQVIVSGAIIFQIVCLFLPLFENKSETYSIFNLLINSWGYEYIAIFLVYFIALIAVLIPNIITNRISSIAFITGAALGAYISWPQIDYINSSSDFYILIFGIWWMFGPLITMLFYLPLIYTKKSIQKSIKTLDKNIAWQRNTPLKDQLLPLLPVILFIALFSIAAVFIEDKLVCPDPANCTVQGDWFSKAAIYLIGSAALAFSVVLSFWPGRGVHPTERKLFRVLLPFAIILFIFMTYYGFSEGLSTNNKGVTIRIFSDWGRKNYTKQINWQDIKSLRLDSEKAYEEYGDDCSFRLYLIKNDNSEFEIDNDYADNNSIWKFLTSKIGLPVEKPKSDYCKVFRNVTWPDEKPIRIEFYQK